MALLLVILFVFVSGLIGLWYLQKKHVKFSTRVFIGLGAGVVFGTLLQLFLTKDQTGLVQALPWIEFVGSGYVAFLQMLIMPLIFVSIVSAFTKMKESSALKRIGFYVLATLLGTTAISALIGIVVTLGFQLQGVTFTEGAAETARLAELVTRQETLQQTNLPERILAFIPTNVFADLAGTRPTSTIAVVIFSAFIGVAYLGIKRKSPKEAEFFARLIASLYAIIMRIVTLVLRLTPFGVFALMTNTLATSDFDAILNLGKFVIASYVALFLVFVMHSLILLALGIKPTTYFKKAFPVLSFAFTARSSAGALPMNVETQTQALGVDEATANFAASFGLSIGQNGCAGVYPAMLAVMTAPLAGIDVWSPQFWLLVVAVVTISSFGVAGVGGGATFASLIVLGSLNLPVTLVGLVISVEPLIDMARTAVNVSDSLVAGLVASKRIGRLDRARLNDPEQTLRSE